MVGAISRDLVVEDFFLSDPPPPGHAAIPSIATPPNALAGAFWNLCMQCWRLQGEQSKGQRWTTHVISCSHFDLSIASLQNFLHFTSIHPFFTLHGTLPTFSRPRKSTTHTPDSTIRGLDASMSSPAPSPDPHQRVTAILHKALSSSERPTDKELGPCYNLLLSDKTSSSSSTSHASGLTHWYCDKAISELHRKAATYLLFLFAFNRQGTGQNWINTLESTVKGCSECARGFGIARREFEAL